MKVLITTIILSFLVCGCATTYQPHGATGGYSERRLSDNSFQIRFNGNGYTHRDVAKDYALLRSAEVTLLAGYKYFVIVDANDQSYVSAYKTPTTASTDFDGTITDTGYGTSNISGSSTTQYSGGQTINIVKPSTDNFIVCFHEKPTGAGLVYDANLIARQLKAQYGVE
jgi:hypothetical protein